MPTFIFKASKRPGDTTQALQHGEQIVPLGGEIELSTEEHERLSEHYDLRPAAAFSQSGQSSLADVNKAPSRSGSDSTLSVKPSDDVDPQGE